MARSKAAKRITVTATWPNPRRRAIEVTRTDKSQARHFAEDLELKGARVTVTEWDTTGPHLIAVLDAFAKRPQLPNDATQADKLAAVKADLAALAAQAEGRRSLR